MGDLIDGVLAAATGPAHTSARPTTYQVDRADESDGGPLQRLVPSVRGMRRRGSFC
jgi:hypothetical protein